jgi:hypothetical protein
MKKRYNIRRITSRRSYSTLELSELLDTHPQTIRDWRLRGLQPIDESAHSSLYLGDEVRRFLSKCEADRKVKLDIDEFYCMHCKQATKASETRMDDTGIIIGHDKASIIRVGKCVKCGGRVRRFDAKPVNLLTRGRGINIEHPTSL